MQNSIKTSSSATRFAMQMVLVPLLLPLLPIVFLAWICFWLQSSEPWAS